MSRKKVGVAGPPSPRERVGVRGKDHSELQTLAGYNRQRPQLAHVPNCGRILRLEDNGHETFSIVILGLISLLAGIAPLGSDAGMVQDFLKKALRTHRLGRQYPKGKGRCNLSTINRTEGKSCCLKLPIPLCCTGKKTFNTGHPNHKVRIQTTVHKLRFWPSRATTRTVPLGGR